MGGYNNTYFRIPSGSNPREFAWRVARELSLIPGPHQSRACHVKQARGHDWIVLETLNFGKHPPNHEQDPLWQVFLHLFRHFTDEAIVLEEQTTASVVIYTHFVRGKFGRYLWTADGDDARGAVGEPEAWEAEAIAKSAAWRERGDVASWPSNMDSSDVISHYRLPSPWSNHAPQWEQDLIAYDENAHKARTEQFEEDIEARVAAMECATVALAKKLGRTPTEAEWINVTVEVNRYLTDAFRERDGKSQSPGQPPPLPPASQ